MSEKEAQRNVGIDEHRNYPLGPEVTVGRSVNGGPDYSHSLPHMRQPAPDLRPGHERKPQRIEIVALNHGYRVTVGCQEVAIESKFRLIDLVTRYLLDPATVEKEYEEGKLLLP